MNGRSVVITGAAAISALGRTAAETWEGVLSGRSGVRPIEGFDASGFACRAAAQVGGLAPGGQEIPPRWERISDLHTSLLLKCSQEAFREARLAEAAFPAEAIGCYLGMGMVDYRVEDLAPAVLASLSADGALDMEAFYSKGFQQIHPLWPLSTLNNIALCQVAIALGISGDNAVFSPDADPGAQAIIEGAEAVRQGRAKAVLAGGVSGRVCPPALARGHLEGALEAAPGDGGADGKGAVPGEGCAVLCLELRASADKRGIPYTAGIAGYGAAFGAADGSPGAAAPAIARAMREALRGAGLSPANLDVLIAHGDGTGAGDGREIEAIHDVFGPSPGALQVFSSKGALGHAQAAGPAVDTVLGMYVLRSGAVPRAAQGGPADPRGQFPLAGGRPLRCSPRRVMVNARGHAGQCASLILESLA
ncbi:MAG TPA: beta-ketoacyl synthase N-terminal-like domain-containing protein [Candidatus Methylomirabilis sp.]